MGGAFLPREGGPAGQAPSNAGLPHRPRPSAAPGALATAGDPPPQMGPWERDDVRTFSGGPYGGTAPRPRGEGATGHAGGHCGKHTEVPRGTCPALRWCRAAVQLRAWGAMGRGGWGGCGGAHPRRWGAGGSKGPRPRPTRDARRALHDGSGGRGHDSGSDVLRVGAVRTPGASASCGPRAAHRPPLPPLPHTPQNQNTFGPTEGQNEQWREANSRRQRHTIRYRGLVPNPRPTRLLKSHQAARREGGGARGRPWESHSPDVKDQICVSSRWGGGGGA